MEVRRRIARDADVLDIFNASIRRAQTILHRFNGKASAMLAPIETLFFGGGD